MWEREIRDLTGSVIWQDDENILDILNTTEEEWR